MKDFYNTVSLKGEDLRAAKSSAKSLQEEVLDFFKKNPDKKFTPPQVHKAIGASYNRPLTSTRRAITNLTGSGDLVNTHDTAPGEYGMPNFLWRLNTTRYPVVYKQITIED